MGRPLHQRVVSASHIQLLFEYLQARGFAPEDVLGANWPQSNRDGLATVKVEHWEQLLQRASAYANAPLVSLQVGQMITSEHLGIVGSVLLSSESLEVALGHFERYQRLVFDVVPMRVEQENDWFELAWDHSQYSVGRMVEEAEYSAVLQVCRSLVGEPVSPLQVRFAHSQPIDVHLYEAFFGCPVLFGHPDPGMRFGIDLLSKPLKSPYRGLGPLLEERANALLEKLPVEDEVVERLHKAIFNALHEGEPDIEKISAKMSCSSRTLQRRLAALNTSFRAELNLVRHGLATEYLRDPRLQIVEISLLLGYSEHSAFTRAFKEWTGYSPQDARRRDKLLTTDLESTAQRLASASEDSIDMMNRYLGSDLDESGASSVLPSIGKSAVNTHDLARLAKVALACGFEIDDLLQDVGVSASGCPDPEQLWDWHQVSRLYESGIRRTTQAHFPFILGEHFTFDRAPEVDAYLATCTTLRDTLLIYDHLPYLIQEDLTGGHEVDERQVHFHVEMHRGGRFMEVPGFIETIFTVILRLFRQASPNMDSYEISFRGQPLQPMDAYVKQYGVKPHFGASNNRISLPCDVLDKPLRGGAPVLHAQAMLALEDRLRRLKARSGLEKAIERMIVQAPYLTLQEVSQSIAMEPRSLQRRLKDAGTSFNTIQSNARFHVARLMLSNRSLDLDAIAVKLGFSDSNGFSKAFSKWAGMPPSQFRKMTIR